MKADRDANFIEKNEQGVTVTVGFLPVCCVPPVPATKPGCDTEICPLPRDAGGRQPGARRHGPTVASLAPTFGRGAMTNTGWISKTLTS